MIAHWVSMIITAFRIIMCIAIPSVDRMILGQCSLIHGMTMSGKRRGLCVVRKRVWHGVRMDWSVRRGLRNRVIKTLLLLHVLLLLRVLLLLHVLVLLLHLHLHLHPLLMSKGCSLALN